ncbi:MAG: acyl-CoA/acyl-ACP dehydrogenase [Pseudomonadales bacterium]|nr:acyl-CoA/acyl-ACP dehydrogenase [Pseudomonadales bacterium]
MDFTFTEDQLLFQDEVKKFLVNEVTPEKIRALWETETGRSEDLWQAMAGMGLTGLTVPEEFGGMGMNAVDFVLLAQACGFVALPEPLVETVLVAVPLINNLTMDSVKFAWLPRIASGEAKVAIGLANNLLVADAHIADLFLLQHGDDEIHAVTKSQVQLAHNESIDPSRKLFSVQWTPTTATCIAKGDEAKKLIADAFNAGALGAAAQALGLTQRMIEISVKYTTDRTQFGKPIGSFQAVKHRLANVAVPLEYAKAVVHRAAYSIANDHPDAALHVSHAKLAASEASLLGAKNGIQVHGAMGYTWEVDMHIFMKKAWALNNTWGDVAFHKNRVADFVLADGAKIGAGNTF